MNTVLSWDSLEDVSAANTQERTAFSWSLSRTFSPTLTGNVGYTFTNNDADLRTSEYDENRIFINVSKSYR